MYPKEKMEEVVKVLSTEYSNLRIFFFGGGKEEKQILNTWAAKYKRLHLCFGSAARTERRARLNEPSRHNDFEDVPICTLLRSSAHVL